MLARPRRRTLPNLSSLPLENLTAGNDNVTSSTDCGADSMVGDDQRRKSGRVAFSRGIPALMTRRTLCARSFAELGSL